MGPNDISTLEVLDEDIILEVLSERYQHNQFYTYIGDILIAFNPFKQLPIYSEEHHENYKKVLVRSSQPPHPFWIAEKAYRSLVETGQNQCILVSGESGAGKTESTKYMIRHLMHISPTHEKNLADKIVEINPLLEAFGNAATLMNRNSSRFGKFIELYYSEDGALLEAKVDDYILEKSRAVHRSIGEKNFHIFYALFAGMSRERLLYYFLEDPDSYRIMRDEDLTDGVFQDPEEFDRYKEMFNNLISIMNDIGFSEEHLAMMFMALAAILHLANIVFFPCDQTDGVTVADEYPLHAVAKLLGIEDEVELTEALISNVSYIKGERIQFWKSKREANTSRDALAKEIYSRLFGWVVGQVNKTLWPKRETEARYRRGPSIGLLDMSGFENFQVNNFEQFLINISNEKLQQYFMENVFQHEKREYELEGIEWRNIAYRSNDAVLDLLLKRPSGLLSLLDEESNFPQSSDVTLIQKLNYYCSTSENYITARGNETKFGICHYAEKVMYNAEGFLEKNRDSLNSDLLLCLLNSQNSFIQDLFTAPMSATGSISDFASKLNTRPKLPSLWPMTIETTKMRENLSRKASLRIKKARDKMSGETLRSGAQNVQATATKHFKRSLADLMTKLSQAQPMFVRCIKPNKFQTGNQLDIPLVRRQLLCNGCLEISELRRDGFPFRIKFKDFTSKFGVIAKDVDFDDKLGQCENILKEAKINGYQLGRTKVFLKGSHRDELEVILSQKLRENELAELSMRNKRQTLNVPNTGPVDRVQSLPEPSDRDSVYEKPPTLDRSQTQKPAQDPLFESTPLPDYMEEKNLASDSNELPEKPDFTYLEANETDTAETASTAAETESFENSGRNKWRPYDIFQISERHFEDNDAIFKEILKVIRLIMYLFLFISIVGSSVASKISLLLIASEVRKSQTSANENSSLLLFCMCSPLACNWFAAFMKVLFGRKEWPSLSTLFWITVLESLQTFGMSLFLFRVLPATDMFRGVVVTFGLCVVPSLLKVIVRDKLVKVDFRRVVVVTASVFALLTQVASIPIFSVFDFLHHENNVTAVVLHNATHGYVQSMYTPISYWELPLAMVLISIGWWENFVSSDWTICNRIRVPFKEWRAVFHDVRYTSIVLVGPVRIGLAILFSHVLIRNHEFAVPSSSPPDGSNKSSVAEHFTAYSLMYLQIGSGVICTYLAGLACKLHMQKAAFATPLVVAPVATILVVLFQCGYMFIPDNWYYGTWLCPGEDITALAIPIGCAGVLWLSYLIIVSHIWFPQSERMAKIEKLFIAPHFDGIFPDFALTLRRRRNDNEVKITHFDTLAFVGEDESSSFYEDPYKQENITPMIYVCATMWHETKNEMTQLLKSLFRLDYIRCASRLAQEKFDIRDPDYFDMEIHIIFDDAWEIDEKANRKVPNSFVMQLVECMEDSAKSVARGPIYLPPPNKALTPYGGKLTWTMPGHTKLVVHIKDKNRIRHRKRWSQCMYMYYLLGYHLLGSEETDEAFSDDAEKFQNAAACKSRHRKKQKPKKNRTRPLAALFRRMRPDQYEKAENTFILTLDGDVDFKPDSVKLLVDRMKKNKKVGAVCGRIHPIGGGPMVWYQQFEYAVGHWLQKAAEHVFGCVLCCPGCFSLFRGSAVMDDNVMKMYTTKPTEARHYIQFEQGEDRWLCTLLLQQGHRIDYCAGADALTFAPETFQEFFNQRRRWSPSTLANMMDLLSSWRDTVRINDNISRPYILYQFILMASTMLAPSTVILMITGAYHAVLKTNIWTSYILSVSPVVLYLFICMTMNGSFQITSAAVLSAIYTIVMMITTVGTIISIATENFGSPNVVFLTGLAIIFVIAGVLHPQEFFCLVYGLLYFLTVPSTFILLTVYYLCNLNIVSWGTREIPKKLSPEEEEKAKQEQEEKRKRKESKSIWNMLGITGLVNEVRQLVSNFLGKAQETKATAEPPPKPPENVEEKKEQEKRLEVRKMVTPAKAQQKHSPGFEPDPSNPYWFHIEQLGNGKIEKISESEHEFWLYILKRYLHPINEDKNHKQKIKEDLVSLKNNVVFIYFMINFLWTIVTLQLQAMEDELKSFYIVQKYEPLSLMFLTVFAIALGLQFFSMFMHRWGTFLHLMSSTRVDWLKNKYSEEDIARFAVQEAQRLQTLEPEPDYQEKNAKGGVDDDGGTSMSSEWYDEYGPKIHTYHRYGPPFWSTNSQVPPLQQIFEQRLASMKRKWEHGTGAPGQYRFQRNDSKRCSTKQENLRREMYNRTFRGRNDALYSVPVEPAM